jgi:hypothetical protein
VRPGTRVRMTEAFKQRSRGACTGPGGHVGHPGWIYDPEMPDDGCAACSWTHVEEFGGCTGTVEGPMFPGDPTAVHLNVRWEPSRLRYGYDPDDLEIVR